MTSSFLKKVLHSLEMVSLEYSVSESELILADFHVHSLYSYDSRMKIETIDHLFQQLGYKVVAITDHNDYRSHQAVQRLNSPLIYIPGVEISTKQGHVLGLNVTDPIPKGLEAQETIDLIHDQGGIAIIAHPFDFLRSGIGKKLFALKHVDALEVYNAGVSFGYMNKKARKAAVQLQLGRTAGSDAHFPDYIGKAWTFLPPDYPIEKADEVIELLHQHKTDGYGQHAGLSGKIQRGLRRLKW